MAKRRPALSDLQMAFSFDVPAAATDAGDLAGFGAMVAAGVARACREDSRTRHEIARAMGDVLGEGVSKAMLDAYCSESREQHSIPAHRWWALIAVTGRWDIADALAARCGARLLSGEEIRAAELGHVQAQMAELQERMRALKASTRPLARSAR
jgi:ubiquinone biosynthesis protein UbiJ